ncbi:menaquinone biosynthetic enzyme MqnA/MqnD family protein [Ammoniphilus resinae]|uniref:Chorismate dehydratase n=1 Tax=Ammoniphilus resinae TaxID=861532 RepID=A0ABS4GT46_9BACL|nr:menaquinone biosynthesis protein [Ammoniphilus resinae]MBP1933454.1 chorismate dehydratase [Ammoniphilus resinae]
MEKVRIGKIAYTNILPVFYFFREKEFADRAEFIHKVPAELNRLLAKGELDLGPVSSFAYGEQADNCVVLSDLSVSAKGPVGSIFLFTKTPLETLEEPLIALTSSSATSVNLLKIILEKFYRLRPQYMTMTPVLDEMMAKADACLLIGDDALSAKLRNPSYYIYDLGELWYKQTGMWMTFALWTVRKELAEQRPSLLKDIHLEFLRAKELGNVKIDDIIKAVQKDFGGDYPFWKAYFAGLCHDFDNEQKRGIEYYYRCAAELGLLPRAVEVAVWGANDKVKLT